MMNNSQPDEGITLGELAGNLCAAMQQQGVAGMHTYVTVGPVAYKVTVIAIERPTPHPQNN